MNQKKAAETHESRRFFLGISFDGTDYNGWQSQPHGNTIQQTLEKTLTGLFADQSIKVQGSGRTDAGVHALDMGVTFSAPPSPYISDDQVMKALNNLLPSSIRINHLKIVPDEFHARFSAQGKAYTYVINTGKTTPFSCRYSWHLYGFNQLGNVRKAADHLQGKHDFAAFTVRKRQREDTVRIIYRIDTQEFGPFLCITFIGNGFLYKMVRSIVGALAKIGTGRIAVADIERILDSKDRSEGEPTCPPHGLFLVRVFYEENDWENFAITKPPFME